MIAVSRLARGLDREFPFFRRESAAEWVERLARLFRCASDGRDAHPTLTRTARAFCGLAGFLAQYWQSNNY